MAAAGLWDAHDVQNPPGQNIQMGKINVCWACANANDPYTIPTRLGPHMSAAKYIFIPLKE